MRFTIQPSPGRSLVKEVRSPAGGVPIDVLRIPPGTLCYINQLAGEVWLANSTPQRRWLRDVEDDAWAATVR